MLRLCCANNEYQLCYAGDDPAVVVALWRFDSSVDQAMPVPIRAVLPRVEVNPAGVVVALSPHLELSRAAAQDIAERVGLALHDATDGTEGTIARRERERHEP